MCDFCRAQKRDWRFINGKNAKLYKTKLFRVFKTGSVPVTLCYLCLIDLFCLGEKRFLCRSLPLLRSLGSRVEKESDNIW